MAGVRLGIEAPGDLTVVREEVVKEGPVDSTWQCRRLELSAPLLETPAK